MVCGDMVASLFVIATQKSLLLGGRNPKELYQSKVHSIPMVMSSNPTGRVELGVHSTSKSLMAECWIRHLSDMKCTVMIWRLWVQTLVGSNFWPRSYLNHKHRFSFLLCTIFHFYTFMLSKLFIYSCIYL